MLDHEKYMKIALQQALRAKKLDEVPIGAILVDRSGAVVARAHNLVERKKSQTAHAEMLALQKLAKKIGDWRFESYTMYVTVQPCGMCMGALILSRIPIVVYGAISPLFGCTVELSYGYGIYKNSLPQIVHLDSVESVQLMKNFFKKQRGEKYDSSSHR